jgi:hypothetical protein
MTKKFIFEISGPGLECGFGKITKLQYNYWHDQEDQLSLALNNKFDYKVNKTSKSCILKNYYNDYQDIASYSGPLVDGSAIKILDEDGNVILNMSPFKISEMFEDDDDFWGGSDEFHSWNNYDVSGYFIKWRLDGSGVYFRGEFHDDEFSINKLKISIFDIDNDRIIDGIFYDEESVLDNGGEWLYNSEDFQLGFNEPPK